MTIQIFTLNALAEKEEIPHSTLRGLINRLLKAGKPLEWEDYRFEIAGKTWFAIPKEFDVQIVDSFADFLKKTG